MDTIGAAHGLTPLSTVQHDDEVELSSLTLELQLELKRLKDDFTVGPITLKKITKRFEEELQAGLNYTCRARMFKPLMFLQAWTNTDQTLYGDCMVISVPTADDRSSLTTLPGYWTGQTATRKAAFLQ